MKKVLFYTLIFAIILATACNKEPEESTVTIKVEASGYEIDGDAVEGASVEVDGQSYITNSTGEVSFVIEYGTYSINISKDGYNANTKSINVNSDLEDFTRTLEMQGPWIKIINNTGANISAGVGLSNMNGYSDDLDWIINGSSNWSYNIEPGENYLPLKGNDLANFDNGDQLYYCILSNYYLYNNLSSNCEEALYWTEVGLSKTVAGNSISVDLASKYVLVEINNENGYSALSGCYGWSDSNNDGYVDTDEFIGENTNGVSVGNSKIMGYYMPAFFDSFLSKYNNSQYISWKKGVNFYHKDYENQIVTLTNSSFKSEAPKVEVKSYTNTEVIGNIVLNNPSTRAKK